MFFRCPVHRKCLYLDTTTVNLSLLYVQKSAAHWKIPPYILSVATAHFFWCFHTCFWAVGLTSCKENHLRQVMNCAVLLKTSIVENDKAPFYIFLNSDKVSVGRHGDVRIDTPGGKEISKIHCYFIKRVQINSAVLIIEDNHYTNGTFVNLRKAQRQLLQNGD